MAHDWLPVSLVGVHLGHGVLGESGQDVHVVRWREARNVEVATHRRIIVALVIVEAEAHPRAERDRLRLFSGRTLHQQVVHDARHGLGIRQIFVITVFRHNEIFFELIR